MREIEAQRCGQRATRADWMVAAVLCAVSLAVGCASGTSYERPSAQTPSGELVGEASWYGPGFAGRSTASGEIFDPGAFTAAHRTLPFGTMVRVIRQDTRQWVVVRVNDRGPFVRGRVIDLSEQAAREIEMIESGHVPVWIEVLPDSGTERSEADTQTRGRT